MTASPFRCARLCGLALLSLLLVAGAASAQQRLFALPDDGSGEIVELDPATLAEINRIPAPGAPVPNIQPAGLGFDGESLFFVLTEDTPTDGAASGASLYRLDPDNGAVLDADVVPGEYVWLDGIGVVGGSVYIMEPAAGGAELQGCTVVHVFDAAAGTFVTSHFQPCLYGGLAGIAEPAALIGSSSFTGEIFEVDPATGAEVSRFEVDIPTTVFAVGVAGGEIYVGGSEMPNEAPGGGYAAPGGRAPSQYFVYSRAGALLRSGALPYGVSAFGADDFGEAPLALEIPTLSVIGLLLFAGALAVAAFALRRRLAA